MAINYYHVIQNCYYMSNDEELIEKIAYVLASQHRTNILDYMGNGLYTPKQIGEAIGVRTNHISNLLSQLKKQDLIYCVTPNMHKGKLYSLTDDGKYVLNHINSKKK